MATGTLHRMRRRKPTIKAATLLEVCLYKVGARKGARVAVFVFDWGKLREQAGHDLTITEYIDLSGTSPRTAYRQLREFREVFDRRPRITPNHVLQAINAAQLAEFVGVESATA